VYEKMSVCKSDEFSYVDTTAITNIAMLLATGRKERKALKVEPTEITGGLEDFDRTVRIGDLVRKSMN